MTLQVFISYKSEYRDIAREVKQRLVDWQYETWLDVDNIAKGTYWPDEIDKGLIASDVLIGVVTKEAFDSRPIKLEWDYFLYEGKTILPCKYDDVKPPPRYITIQHIDFTKDKEKAFAELKERLAELAAVSSSAPAEPEPARDEAPKPGGAALDDVIPFEKERKREALEDGLFGAPALAPQAPLAKPQAQPPPPPSVQPASGATAPLPVTASQPASAPFQPARQPQTMLPSVELGGAPRSKRGSPILWPLAAVASLIVVVGIVILLGTATASPGLSGAEQIPSQTPNPLIWVVGVLVVIGVVGLLIWWRIGRKSAVPDAQTDAANRATMLQNVEDFWLKGVLDPALEAGSLDIGLSAAPGAVLRHKDYGDYALPPNANILDVFNDLNRELLILGAPGGGKTVLLLQLARELITQARQDATKAIPVVFNLSSWAAERKSLADWLVDELKRTYKTTRKVAVAWIEGEKLLLLLDGLDEVAEQYRNECVDAINRFRQQYRTVDLAICSRVNDYESLINKLDVRGAIVLEPLNQPIIDAYLNRPELANLRVVMSSDKELQAMSEVPFVLNVMAYAYKGATLNNLQIPTNGDLTKLRRTHLFDRWVEKRLKAMPSDDYTPSKVRRWLGWLAEQMTATRKSANTQYAKIKAKNEEMKKDYEYHFRRYPYNGDLIRKRLNDMKQNKKELDLAFEYMNNMPSSILIVKDIQFLEFFSLWFKGHVTLNYARFLDYCASAGLMRKVGGGYIFAHRYLMEYFAESYAGDQK